MKSLLLCIALLSAGLQAQVRVEKINYKGWPNSYRMTNGEVELVVIECAPGRETVRGIRIHQVRLAVVRVCKFDAHAARTDALEVRAHCVDHARGLLIRHEPERQLRER